MSDETLNRIADALERIAKVMENEEKRTVNQNVTERRKQRLLKEVRDSLNK
jgi:hypothetical protein